MEQGGFQVVTRKRRCKVGGKKRLEAAKDLEDEPISFEDLKVKIWQARQELKPSEFIQQFKETWKSVQDRYEADPNIVKLANKAALSASEPISGEGCSSLPPELIQRLQQSDTSEPNKNEVIKSIICYGLGNFSTCVTARYQLAFLLLLSNMTQIPHIKCFCYDPRFLAAEISFLEDLGLSIIKENEEGKRVCTEPTLFFMPHCGKPLYNNLLWANWGQNLFRIIILGNRFSSFSERLPKAQLLSEAAYISKILPYATEERVTNNFRYRDIFNDLAFHIFNMDNLGAALDPTEMWNENSEPNYDHMDEVEIIQK